MSEKEEWFQKLQWWREVSPTNRYEERMFKACICGAKFYGGFYGKWMDEHFIHHKEAKLSYDRLDSAARIMHFDLIKLGQIPLQEMVDRFGMKENG